MAHWLWILLVYSGLLVAAFAALGCIALTLFQLPGNWVMLLLALVVAWLHGPELTSIEIGALVVMAILATLGEIVELLASAVGTRTAGGTRRGAALALLLGVIGAIVGTFVIPIPVVGTIAGGCLGAGVGAGTGDLWAGRRIGQAAKASAGAAVGKFGGTVMKLVVACLMWVACLFALFGG